MGTRGFPTKAAATPRAHTVTTPRRCGNFIRPGSGGIRWESGCFDGCIYPLAAQIEMRVCRPPRPPPPPWPPPSGVVRPADACCALGRRRRCGPGGPGGGLGGWLAWRLGGDGVRISPILSPTTCVPNDHDATLPLVVCVSRCQPRYGGGLKGG